MDFFVMLLDFIAHWRFQVCLFVGIGLAFLIAPHVPVGTTRWIVAGAMVAVGCIIGWRWDNAR